MIRAKHIGCIMGCVVGVIVVLACGAFIAMLLHSMRDYSQYADQHRHIHVTYLAIRYYCEDHGRWPQGWEDLQPMLQDTRVSRSSKRSDIEELKQFVCVKWDFDLDAFLEQSDTSDVESIALWKPGDPRIDFIRFCDGSPLLHEFNFNRELYVYLLKLRGLKTGQVLGQVQISDSHANDDEPNEARNDR